MEPGTDKQDNQAAAGGTPPAPSPEQNLADSLPPAPAAPETPAPENAPAPHSASSDIDQIADQLIDAAAKMPETPAPVQQAPEPVPIPQPVPTPPAPEPTLASVQPQPPVTPPAPAPVQPQPAPVPQPTSSPAQPAPTQPLQPAPPAPGSIGSEMSYTPITDVSGLRQADQASQPAQENQQPKKKNTTIIVIVALLAVVIIAIIVVVVVMLSNQKQPTTTTSSYTAPESSYTKLTCKIDLTDEEKASINNPAAASKAVTVDYIEDEVQDAALSLQAQYESAEVAEAGARSARDLYTVEFQSAGLSQDPFTSYYSLNGTTLSVIRFAEANQVTAETSGLLDLLVSRSGKVVTDIDSLERNYTNLGYTCEVEDREDDTPSTERPDDETLIDLSEDITVEETPEEAPAEDSDLQPEQPEITE